MSRPNNYQLLVPEGWHRVDLQPGVREPAIARLVGRQFEHAADPGLKAQVREQLLRAAQHAYGNGGLEL